MIIDKKEWKTIRYSAVPKCSQNPIWMNTISNIKLTFIFKQFLSILND